MADRVLVFFGPDKAFEKYVEANTSKNEVTVSYFDSVRVYNSRIRATELASKGAKYAIPEEVDNCVVRANDFGSVLSHVISSFSSILEEAYEIGTLFVQNPPKRALSSLRAAHPDDAVEEIFYEYKKVDKDDLPKLYRNLASDVLGQEASKKSLVSSLYRLSVMQDERPSVILLYGPSGVGKTETAKCLSESLGGVLTRVQFSMMQTAEAYDYLFGAEHSKASFARDLLGRESNIVLIDEFDKVQSGLYNMFYQLFDEGRFVDTNYDVDMKNGLFLLTSNFSSEKEARRAMGPAIFSRINDCVRFEELSTEHKAAIAKKRYMQIYERLCEEDKRTIDASDILTWFSKNAGRFNNMRTMKNKVEKAIFELLSMPILEETDQ